MKAVVDSSVLISAFLTPKGAAGTLVTAGLKGRFEAYLSADILAETSRRLHDNRKLQQRYAFTNDEVSRYVERLAAAVPVLRDFPAITPVCCDPNNDHVPRKA